MELYFRNSKNKETKVAEVLSIDEALKIITKYVRAKQGKDFFYTRYWSVPEKNYTKFDFGSWTEFFILRGYVINA